MIAVVDSPRLAALKKVFAAYRADTSKLVAEAYKEGLADIPDDVLVPAIDAAIQGEAFMPSVARLRTYADRVKPSVPELPPATVVDPAKLLTGQVKPLDDSDPRTWAYCSACRDTGWVESVREFKPPYTMPVATNAGVENRVIHTERRSYFAHCSCRPTNPKMAAERLRRTKYSRESTE